MVVKELIAEEQLVEENIRNQGALDARGSGFMT